jgi:hypothetical protein
MTAKTDNSKNNSRSFDFAQEDTFVLGSAFSGLSCVFYPSLIVLVVYPQGGGDEGGVRGKSMGGNGL